MTQHTGTAAQIPDSLQAAKAMEAQYKARLNEGGEGYNPHTSEVIRLEDAYSRQVYAAQLAAEDAEWTKEVTIQRRAAWNAWVRSQGGTVHPLAMAAYSHEVGYGMALLRRQIARHGL